MSRSTRLALHASTTLLALQVDTVTTFYCSAGAGIVGAFFTWIFLPDTTGLDLAEIDRYHRFMLAGQVREGRPAESCTGRSIPPPLLPLLLPLLRIT